MDTQQTEKRIFAIGRAGFLGPHLCEQLSARSCELLCVNNYFTRRRSNSAHLMSRPLFEMMRHDITFPINVELDEICNLVCPASPIHYHFDPVQTTKTNLHDAINIRGLAKRVNAKILQVSTSEVYDDSTVHPQRETYRGRVNSIASRACYHEGKRCAQIFF